MNAGVLEELRASSVDLVREIRKMIRCRSKREKAELTEISKKNFDSKQKSKKFDRQLVKYDELPDYLKDNEFILDYYRSEWPLKAVLWSIFSLHNETLNIWTHLAGFFIFVGMTVISLTERAKSEGIAAVLFRNEPRIELPLLRMMMNNNTIASEISIPEMMSGGSSRSSPMWPWFIFLSGAMSCLIGSSVSHLLACHSRTYNLFFWRLDYAGISLMIVCSFFAPIYYAFHCHPYSCFFYLLCISLFGIITVVTLLSPALSAPCYRRFRAALFLAMGFSGLLPAIHAFVIHWDHPHVVAAMAYELAMACFYAFGVGFYVARVPERWKPGAFDLAGHSHQIFHVFVVAGALAHTAATLVIMDLRQHAPICG